MSIDNLICLVIEIIEIFSEYFREKIDLNGKYNNYDIKLCKTNKPKLNIEILG